MAGGQTPCGRGEAGWGLAGDQILELDRARRHSER
jgi:hypothetical protein